MIILTSLLAVAALAALPDTETATAQSAPAAPAAAQGAAAASPRLYCGRLRVGVRLFPDHATCKSIPDWQSFARFTIARERETRQIINIGAGAAGNR